MVCCNPQTHKFPVKTQPCAGVGSAARPSELEEDLSAEDGGLVNNQLSATVTPSLLHCKVLDS